MELEGDTWKVGRQFFHALCDEKGAITGFLLFLTKRLISIAYRENDEKLTKERVEGANFHA
ncbi:MAG: hypothetical protein ABGX20_14295 [Bacillus sp. (in: firmicutes)]